MYKENGMLSARLFIWLGVFSHTDPEEYLEKTRSTDDDLDEPSGISVTVIVVVVIVVVVVLLITIFVVLRCRNKRSASHEISKVRER